MILAIAVLLVIAVVLFVVGVRARDVPPPEPPSATAHLEERKARIYDNLRDLQFEFRVGKLSDEDYQRTKLGLQKELSLVLAEIDGLTVKPAPKPAAVETVTNPIDGDSSTATLLICPHCGATFDRPLRFCGECGKPLASGARV